MSEPLSAPPPDAAMTDAELILAKMYAAGVRGHTIPDGSAIATSLLAEVARLRAALADAEADTKRINWLDALGQKQRASQPLWMTTITDQHTYTNVREAIDAALATSTETGA